MSDIRDPHRHAAEMRRQRQEVRRRIVKARRSKGLIIYLFGTGKGKSSSAFGTLCRGLGHGKRGGIVQFIKGTWRTGEQEFFQSLDGVEYQCMGSGFTWDTQDRAADQRAAQGAWAHAAAMLSQPELDMVVLDEIAYMFAYEYLDAEEVVRSLRARPPNQHVFLTGRPRIACLVELADTVSEVVEVKHAFHDGIKAQKGVEW